nr:MAG TPA: hypothetical protein [Caudoviricetes sp.]
MNLTRPSLSLLPMEDIAAELKSNKANRKFMTREDKATDVENVAGIKSDRIAISAEGYDRETVQNALKLNGVSADGYVTKEQGDKFLQVSTDLSEIVSNEIRNLRDELYQLYAELSKKGFIDNTMKYEGFVESFKRGNVLFEDYICGISSAAAGRTKDLYIADIEKKHYFEKGKKFVIKESDTGNEQVVTSTGINAAGKVTFEPAVNNLNTISKIGLFKTNGEYNNNTFSFSNIKKAVSEQVERYYTQSDDTDTKYLTIKRANTGYAITFKVPRNIKSELGIAGALSQFAVRAQAVNAPGGLRCHVVDFDSVIQNGELNPKFDNIQDAIEKGYCLASSDIVYSTRDNTAMENDVYFDFYGGVHSEYKNGTKNSGSVADGEISFASSDETVTADTTDVFETADNFPILKDAKYCFILECLGATEDSYWRLRFSYYNNNGYPDDLHRRNASYVYKAISSDTITDSNKCVQVIDDVAKYDLIYTLIVKDIIDEEEVGKAEGIYTARLILPKPIDVARARLTLRINREGMYNVKEHNSEYKIFVLESDTPTSHTASDTRFVIGEKIIIGNTIATVKRVSTTEIEVENAAYLDERIVRFYTKTVYDSESNSYVKKTSVPVYRMGYEPTIKAKLVDWDNYNELTTTYESTDISEEPIDLDFVAVMPDQYKDNTRVSDRLLFEADFGQDENNRNILANEFELQLYWSSPFSEKEINAIKDTNDRNFKELIGRIHDLSLSFDKNY